MRCARGRADGFTLVEILVVLAILVILFSLLIVPLISGLDMASRGRSALKLQDAARAALERIRADLQDAVYVCPTEMLPDPSNPGEFWPNASQVVFVPPERDASDQVVEPLRHALIDQRACDPALPSAMVQRAICIGVRPTFGIDPAQPDKGYNENNPFVLYRMQGMYAPDPAIFEPGFDPTTWRPGFRELAGSGREALTPRQGFDILPARWICMSDSATGTEYPTRGLDPVHYWANLACVFKGFEVKAKRVPAEELQADSSALVYRASTGLWDGRPIVCPVIDPMTGLPHPQAGRPRELDDFNGDGVPDGTDYLNKAVDPRIVVLRFVPDPLTLSDITLDPRQGEYSAKVYDSFDPGLRDDELDLQYDLTKGAVTFGRTGRADLGYNSPSDADGDGVFDLVPLPAGMSVDGAWAFRVVPPQGQTVPAPPPPQPQPGPRHPTKIVPDGVRVWVQRVGDGGYIEYTRTDEQDPDEIGAREFCARVVPRTGNLELRFNRYRFARMAVQYAYRRNFTRIDMRLVDAYVGGGGAGGDEVFDVDDKVIVDYSTRQTLIAMLELCDVISQDDPSLPPTQVVQSARMTAEINLHNLGA
jgi:prepilin-type N-terminal cleavage/methylation domain-containing protein